MTLLSDMHAKFPIRATIELCVCGKSIGIFEVGDVNCAVGAGDASVQVWYRRPGESGPGDGLLIFTDASSFPYSMNDLQIRVDRVTLPKKR